MTLCKSCNKSEATDSCCVCHKPLCNDFFYINNNNNFTLRPRLHCAYDLQLICFQLNIDHTILLCTKCFKAAYKENEIELNVIHKNYLSYVKYILSL